MEKNYLSIFIVAFIAVIVALMLYFGVFTLSLGATDNDADGMSDPIGSDYCGYSTGDIIGMFKNLMGKDLNNDVGFTVVNALNIEACGSDSRVPSEIIAQYTADLGDDWYIIYDDTTMRTGFYYRSVVWGNTNSIWNATLIKSVISGSGVTVKEWYNYNTVTATGYGTRSGYLGFVAWLQS